MKVRAPLPILIDESLSSSVDERDCICCNTPISPPLEDEASFFAYTTPLTEYGTESDYETDDELSFYDLLHKLSDVNEELLLSSHGYAINKTLCDTLQGELLIADVINDPFGKQVSIKKTDKLLHQQHVSVEDGMNFIVDENIVSEANILHALTVTNRTDPMSHYIRKYINFFESETHYYLVTEYDNNSLTLKDYIQKCHKYISDKQLSLKKYKKVIKTIFFQLSMTINWLHNSMQCTHLDICSENILLSNAFIQNGNDQKIILNSDVLVRIIDFGCAEMYTSSDPLFTTDKYALSMENEQYLAPEVCNNSVYDGRSVDLWAVGMIFYSALVGSKPYSMIPDVSDISELKGSGYWAVYSEEMNAMERHLRVHNLRKYINKKEGSLQFLVGLLKVNESKRFNANRVLNHKYFICV